NSFDKALKITPNDAIILKNKDLALEKLVDQNRLKDSNALALGLNNNGIGYFKQGKYAEAINAFDQALRLTPNDAIILKNKDLALEQHRLKDSNALALGLNNGGNEYFKQGKYAEAINEYNQALRLTPNDETIKNNRDNAQKQIDQLKNKSSTRSDDFEVIWGIIAVVIGVSAIYIGFGVVGAPILIFGLAGIY